MPRFKDLHLILFPLVWADVLIHPSVNTTFLKIFRKYGACR